MPNIETHAPVLTLREVSRYLHVHPSTIYKLLRNGRLPAFKIGSDWRFNVEAIDRWRHTMEAGDAEASEANGSNGRAAPSGSSPAAAKRPAGDKGGRT